MPELLTPFVDSRPGLQSQPAAPVVAQLRGVSKRYGQLAALQSVDLAIHPGEVVALLGPNGAGKTTAISILLGLRRPDHGEARLFGQDPRHYVVRRSIGATPQDTGFQETLTVQEVVELVRAHYPHPLATAEVLARFGLQEVQRRQTGGLSGGQRRRLAVALAFVGNPKAVFLDEPTTGLDVAARRELWQAVRAYVAAGGTVLLTTHYLEEAEALATRVVVLNRGQVVATGSVEEIQAQVGLSRVRFHAAELPPLPGVVRQEHDNGWYTLYTRDADEVVRHLVGQQVAFTRLEVQPLSLEEAFLALTGGSA